MQLLLLGVFALLAAAALSPAPRAAAAPPYAFPPDFTPGFWPAPPASPPSSGRSSPIAPPPASESSDSAQVQGAVKTAGTAIGAAGSAAAAVGASTASAVITTVVAPLAAVTAASFGLFFGIGAIGDAILGGQVAETEYQRRLSMNNGMAYLRLVPWVSLPPPPLITNANDPAQVAQFSEWTVAADAQIQDHFGGDLDLYINWRRDWMASFHGGTQQVRSNPNRVVN